jgi:hypothetical protein
MSGGHDLGDAPGLLDVDIADDLGRLPAAETSAPAEGSQRRRGCDAAVVDGLVHAALFGRDRRRQATAERCRIGPPTSRRHPVFLRKKAGAVVLHRRVVESKTATGRR